MGAQHSQRFTASDFRRIAKRNPQEAEQYLRDTVPDISGEVEQRRAVMGGLVHISGELPYAVKPFVGQLVSRVDDVDPEVRTNALLTISHCVQYYPHEFSNISSVLYHSLLDGVDFGSPEWPRQPVQSSLLDVFLTCVPERTLFPTLRELISPVMHNRTVTFLCRNSSSVVIESALLMSY